MNSGKIVADGWTGWDGTGREKSMVLQEVLADLKNGKGMLSKKPENWRLDWKTGDWMVSKKPGNRMLSKNS